MSARPPLPPPRQSTALHSHPVDVTIMPPTPSLTLILAATPSLGIGKAGGLPWPQLKKEMGYFARVTKRVAPSTTGPKKINAVIMGSTTWDSIPPKFRPLKDRLNIVITRDIPAFKTSRKLEESQDVEGSLICSGILDALSKLEELQTQVDKIFVIGGASVYRTALELPQTKHILLTQIRNEYECDTFFSLNLEETETWSKKGRKELEQFTGEDIQEGEVEEQGVRFEFCLFEKNS